MSSPERDSFEITDQDRLNEFNPNRPSYRQTKIRATYGVWAEDSDEEDERPRMGKKDKGHKSYTAPIGFVSVGVKVGDKISKKRGEDAIDSDTDGDTDAVAPIEKPFKRQRLSTHRMAQGAPGNASIGGWERHTKGVGSKLMEQMGYVPGKGLGKNLHGISTPVEAKKRAGKGTIGFHGSERTQRSLIDFPTKPDSDEEDEKAFPQQLQQWKKGTGEEKKKKPKYIYRTADELLIEGSTNVYSRQKGSEKTSEISKVKVIDMTGKEQRILSGYHALGHKLNDPRETSLYSQARENTKAFDMPELLHNLDLLVDTAEDEIIQSDRKLKHNEDMVVNLQHEKVKLDKRCDEEEQRITRLKKVLEIIEECDKRSGVACPNAMDLDEYAQVFKDLQENYSEEYSQYGLCELATVLVTPIMKSDFEAWEPLQEPHHSVSPMLMWKELFDDSTTRPLSQRGGMMNTYERLAWEVWMPHVRQVITTEWNPREPDTLIDLLEAWMPLLPEWMINNVLEQFILHKLEAGVDTWNPLTDTLPIHGWIHPWLPLMGERLDILYAPIRHKLADALTNWHPSDTSAKHILQPWQEVFPKSQMDAFLIKHIAPKLALSMQQFVISPSQQSLDAWNWVMYWLDMVPQHEIVSILQTQFFPKFLQVLCQWLSANPNLKEVSQWYMGWKSMIPEVLANEPIIKEELKKALNIMNRAATGLPPLPSASPAPPPPPPVPSQAALRILPSSTAATVNFKDLIEQKARELGVLFMPIPNRTHEAKQIYTFGSSQIYIDRNVVFKFERDGVSMPISLNELVNCSANTMSC